MNESIISGFPDAYLKIEARTREAGFSMASDVLTCSLLRTLAAGKPGGQFLELGTGTGLGTSWILDGMDGDSTLTSLDNDPAMLQIAEHFLGSDPRLELLNMDGTAWINGHPDLRFDFIFADTWPGKYWQLPEVLAMLKKGGLYIIDDMLPQPNWPEGHAQKAKQLERELESFHGLTLTKMAWATGIMIACKK